MGNRLFIVLTLLIYSSFSFGQIKISGKVYELNSRTRLSNCSITAEKGKAGTISNEEGEFELIVSKSEKRIVVSHVGYRRESIEIRPGNDVEVFLEPLSIPLKGVVVGNPALAYLNAAIKKSATDSTIRKHFRGYLRSTLTENSKLKSFNEVLFEGEWGSKGISSWKPVQNRYAIEEDALYKSQSVFNFFSSFVKTGSIIKSKIIPNSVEADKKKYEFRIVKSFALANNDEAVEILCTPKVKKKPFFEGKITINTETDNILRIDGVYHQEKSERNIAKNQTYEYELNLSESRSGQVTFESFRMTTKAKVKSTDIVENTLIFKIEESPSAGKGLVSVRKSQANLIQRDYNESFWRNNQVVRYTSIQQNLVDNFNNKKKFVSNFLK